jgi:hypothetical protein
MDDATARRAGGDGLLTGMAHVFGPIEIGIGAVCAFAALAAWLGWKRWWLLQILLASAGLCGVASGFLVLMVSR